MDIAAWLRDLGLERYERAFRDGEIDAEVLPELTDEHLKELGLPLGPRLKLLKAVAALRAGAQSQGQVGGPAASVPSRPATPEAEGERPSTVVPREAERRQLTVMFADLVGSTELASRLDPEDLREVIGAYHATAAEAVVRFGGHVAKYVGDGVLAYFGWPRAQEDAAERAVRAGLALAEAVGRLGPRGGPALRVRVGIATGLVVVGALGTEATAARDEVVGETPNLAARLQALAEPGAVLVSGTTRRLIGSVFACEDLGARPLRGFPAPVATWRVTWETTAARPRPMACVGHLVGRGPELARLLERWERAEAGRGQVALLTGEAGIGKSRLVEALRERLAGGGHAERNYACSPLRRTSPLHPVLDRLGHDAGLRRDEAPERGLAKLAAALGVADAEGVRDVLPAVAELLGVPADRQDPAIEAGARRRRERMLEALAEHALRRLPDRPLLLVFEDVYWADPTSLELLGRLVERVRGLPVLLVVTARPGFVPAWSALPHVLVLAVDPLSRAESGLLAAATVGDLAIAQELLERILDRAGGVPLFVEELTKAAVEACAAEGVPDRPAPTSPTAPAVPETLQDGLMARLDRLGPARRVAEVGAAIGQGFPLELLAAVLPWPRAELEGALAALLGSGLVRKAWEGARPAYAFRHALVREVAYATLLRERRREFHARIAETLERRFPGTPPELLAYHHARAGATRQAVRCWLRAGELSLRRAAPAEAVAQLSAGLGLLAELPGDDERHREEIRLHLALGQALGLTKGRAAPEVGQAFGRACDLGRQVGHAPETGAALLGLYGYHLHRAGLNEARAAAGELLHLAEWRGDPVTRAAAQGLGGSIAFFLGRLPEARSSLEAALADDALARSREFATHGVDPRQLGLAHLAWTVLVLGRPDEARRRGYEAIAEAEAPPRRPDALAAALFADGVVHQLVRDRPAVLARAERLAALAGEQDFPLWLAGAAVLRGWSLAEGGGPGGAMREMCHGLAAWRATGAEHLVPYFQALLADACARAGRPAEGLRLVADGLSRTERTGERWCEAELLRLRGELLLLRAGRHRREAEAHLRRACAVARRQGARAWELRASVSLARLTSGGSGGRIRRLLGPVYEGFAEGFDTPDLVEAGELLSTLA